MVMGCISSKADIKVSDEERKRSREIDKEIQNSKNHRPVYEIKLLLLGAGESGKSTVCRQIRIIHMNELSEKSPVQLLSFKPIIELNIVECVDIMITILTENDIKTKIQRSSKNLGGVGANVVDLSKYAAKDLTELNEQFLSLVNKNETIKRNIYRLPDSKDYWFKHINRILEPKYIPTRDDCLRSRQKTTGIVEVPFTLSDQPFKLIDVGGQRSERKKWIHAFEGVTSLIFVTSLIEYDQLMVEDESTNRLTDSLALFESTCQTRWFAKSSIILFLNKTDLFVDRIKVSPLSKYFPEFPVNSDGNYEAALNFMEEKFQTRNKSGKTVYVHSTCATNTENMRFIFNSVKDTIVTLFTQNLGF